MKKILLVVFMVLLVAAMGSLAGCSFFGKVDVTVEYTGTNYDNLTDYYVAIALGSYNFYTSTPEDGDIVEKVEFTPKETKQTTTFSVSKNENYTVFIFRDANSNKEFDSGELIRAVSPTDTAYLEEDTTVTLDYNY